MKRLLAILAIFGALSFAALPGQAQEEGDRHLIPDRHGVGRTGQRQEDVVQRRLAQAQVFDRLKNL